MNSVSARRREENGAKVHELGQCPASYEFQFDGVHGGSYGGRACWVIAGTLCDGRIQGTQARKLGSCLLCPFYRTVLKEEGADFMLTSDLERIGEL